MQSADDQSYSNLLSVGSGREAYFSRSNLIPISSELDQFKIISIWYSGPTSRDSRQFIQRFEITGTFDRDTDPVVARRRERQREAAEATRVQQEATRAQQAEIEAERTAPRFSPEGQEYIKRTLTQAVGEVNNPSNRGRTLFFESRVDMRESGVEVGQWRITEIGSSNPIFMYYYERIPHILVHPVILYRVEISNIGIIRYTIDSFRSYNYGR